MLNETIKKLSPPNPDIAEHDLPHHKPRVITVMPDVIRHPDWFSIAASAVMMTHGRSQRMNL
jgi:hypothetical protein